MSTAVPLPAAEPNPGRDPGPSRASADRPRSNDDGFSPVLTRARARADSQDHADDSRRRSPSDTEQAAPSRPERPAPSDGRSRPGASGHEPPSDPTPDPGPDDTAVTPEPAATALTGEAVRPGGASRVSPVAPVVADHTVGAADGASGTDEGADLPAIDEARSDDGAGPRGAGSTGDPADPVAGVTVAGDQPGAEPSANAAADPVAATPSTAAVVTDPTPATSHRSPTGEQAENPADGQPLSATANAPALGDRGHAPSRSPTGTDPVASEPVVTDAGRRSEAALASAGPTGPDALTPTAGDLSARPTNPEGIAGPSSPAPFGSTAPLQPGAAAEGALVELPTEPGSATTDGAAGSSPEADELWGQVQRALNRIRPAVDGQELRIRLHPAELGELLVQVRTQGDQLTVRLVTASAAAQQILLGDQQRLTAELAAAGFDDGAVDISHRDSSGSGSGPDSGDRRGRWPGSDPTAQSPRPPSFAEEPVTATSADTSRADGRRRAGLVDLTL